MRFRALAAALLLLITGPAVAAWDPARAPGYASPPMYRPEVDSVIVHGTESTGQIPKMSATANGAAAGQSLGGWFSSIVLGTPTAATLRSYNRLFVAPGTSIYVSGYYAAGDGGGGLFTWSNTSSATDDGVIAFNPTGNGAAGRWIRNLSGPLRVEMAGARCNGTFDDAPAFRAAIAAARTLALKEVWEPARTCGLASTVAAPDWSNIRLRGAGRGAVPGAVLNTQSAVQDGTILKWIGPAGGTMVDTRSPAADRPYLTSAMEFTDTVLDGNGLADVGLYTRGMVNSTIRIKFRHVRKKGYDLDVYDGGGADVQGNIFNIQGDLDYDRPSTGDPAVDNVWPDGWVIGPGTSYNNTHHNWIESVRIITRNGTGWVIGNADSNTGANIQINYPYQPAGNVYTGIGMDFRAAPNALGPGGVTQAARSNVFFGVSNVAPTYARAGNFGLPSYGNVLLGFIQDSAEPNPVIEPGAGLDWCSALGGCHIALLTPGKQIWKSPGDFDVMLQNSAGQIVGYFGTEGIMNGVPADSIRIRGDKGVNIGSGGGPPAIAVSGTNVVTFPQIKSYPSNTAAANDNLPVGGLFLNTASGALALRQ